MRNQCSYTLCSLLCQNLCSIGKSICGVNDIITDNNVPVGHVTDDRHGRNFIRALTILIAYHHFLVKVKRKLTGTVYPSNIRGSKCYVREIKRFDVGEKDG